MADVIIEGPDGARRVPVEQAVRAAGKQELARLALSGVAAAKDEWRRRQMSGELDR